MSESNNIDRSVSVTTPFLLFDSLSFVFLFLLLGSSDSWPLSPHFSQLPRDSVPSSDRESLFQSPCLSFILELYNITEYIDLILDFLHWYKEREGFHRFDRLARIRTDRDGFQSKNFIRSSYWYCTYNKIKNLRSTSNTTTTTTIAILR